MINISYFPYGLGMAYNAPITEKADKSITVDGFNFSLGGRTYAIAGGTFTLGIGDALYITSGGLKQYKNGEYPIADDLFPNNSAHWLITRTGEDEFIALEVR